MTLDPPPAQTKSEVTTRVKVRRSNSVREKKKRIRQTRKIVITACVTLLGIILLVLLMKHLIYDANSVRPPTIQSE